MRRHVFPQPPSPTTTIFLEYAVGSVASVAADSRPLDVLGGALEVPSLELAR